MRKIIYVILCDKCKTILKSKYYEVKKFIIQGKKHYCLGHAPK